MIPKPKVTDIDAEMQAVFDALDTYIADTSWVTANASVTFDGSGTTHTMNCSDRTRENGFTFTQRNAGVRVSVSPITAMLGPGQTQQFTASATDTTGAAVPGATFTWNLTGGAGGAVDATGLYTAPATIDAATSETVTAVLGGQQSWAAVTVQLQP